MTPEEMKILEQVQVIAVSAMKDVNRAITKLDHIIDFDELSEDTRNELIEVRDTLRRIA